VYVACRVSQQEGECNYVIKVLESNKATITQVNIRSVLNEVECQIKASKHNISPKIYDVFFCLGYKRDHITGSHLRTSLAMSPGVNLEGVITRESIQYPTVKLINTKIPDLYRDKVFEVSWCRRGSYKDDFSCFVPFRRFYIIMEKMDITISSFLKRICAVDRDIHRVLAKNLKDKAFSILDKLHKLHIIHGDAHSSNFMFNFTEKGKEIFASINEKKVSSTVSVPEFQRCFESLKIVDFGTSQMYDPDTIDIEIIERNQKLDKKKLSETILL
jgi:serine/threonine protein kinase